jgi:hypothetical protein
MTAALLAALIAPAKAQDFNTSNVAYAVASMMGYQMKCGPLPPRTAAMVDMLVDTGGIDKAQFTAEALNVRQTMTRVGMANWCAGTKSIIDRMENVQ